MINLNQKEFCFGSLNYCECSYNSCNKLFQGSKNYLGRWEAELDKYKPEVNDEETKKEEKEKGLEKLQASIIQTVKALCAHWLKMQSVVVFVGSGASLGTDESPLGLLLDRHIRPLCKQYLEKVVDSKRLSNQKLIKLFDEFYTEKKNFEQALSNLISVYKLLEEGSLNEPLKDFSKAHYKDLIEEIQKVIFYCCNLKLPSIREFNPEESEKGYIYAHRELIRKLVARDSKLSRAKLVTTNYDTLLEQAMDSQGVFYMDGFIGSVNRKFDTSCFGLDYYYPGEMSTGSVRRFDKFVHLYKLHGSINWWINPNKKGFDFDKPFGIEWKHQQGEYFKHLQDSQQHFEAIQKTGDLFKDKWLGIQPTCIKYAETMGMPFSQLFRYFANALQEPQTVCFVLGYSFGDEHINQVIFDALANPSFTLVIVNPFLNPIIKAILEKEQCERIYCFAGEWAKFDQFVSQVMPDLAELETELKIIQTLKELKNIPLEYKQNDFSDKTSSHLSPALEDLKSQEIENKKTEIPFKK